MSWREARRDGHAIELGAYRRRSLLALFFTVPNTVYDPTTDSVWMPIGDTIVNVLLDAAVWADRACGVLSRDFTQTEWNLYVPGDLPLRPMCGEGA